MAFDQPTRNRLNRFVSEARALLMAEFARQIQSDYGIDPGSGRVDEVDSITHLDDRQRETARILRDTLDHYMAGKNDKKTRQAAIDRLVREQAFTVLNRLAALRMMEARGFLVQSIAEGVRSDGFQLYQQLAGIALGETDETYIAYLFSLFDEFAVELPVLFDRFSPEGRLFPSVRVLRQLLALFNDSEIDPLWAEDETIGWIYQYFNSIEERRQMRAASGAPRNSRELAVRNQFFTPRYVVEFLTDNTLGRIWHEMTKGETRLADECRYLVRRPNELFLAPGEEAPQQETTENLSQEELLQQTVYIPHRPLKDPREIKMLDPACGSMHFGLYAFDLFETIYDEAWEIGVLGDWAAAYADKAAYMRDVPRLIIERNIHGIDIDARAVQIAGLSLWLRAQRSWQTQGLPAVERPVVTRSNVVVAEPMPGDKVELEAFLAEQFTGSPQNLIVATLVRRVFEAMKLAGEAGSLLKIEEAIAEDIAMAREQWTAPPEMRQKSFLTQPEQDWLPLDAPPPTDDQFWHQLEARIYTALEAFSIQVTRDDSYRRRLFAHDAIDGFALIKLSQESYEAVLANPPFGLPTGDSRHVIQDSYDQSWTDLYAAFIERALDRVSHNGLVGMISPTKWLYSRKLKELRRRLLSVGSPRLFVELGNGVMDNAAVEAGLIVCSPQMSPKESMTLDLLQTDESLRFLKILPDNPDWRPVAAERYQRIHDSPFAYHLENDVVRLWQSETRLQPSVATVTNGNRTFDDFRYLRLWWEVSANDIGEDWLSYRVGGDFQPFVATSYMVVNWADAGMEMRQDAIARHGTDAQVMQSSTSWFRAGLAYPRVGTAGFGVRCAREGEIYSHSSVFIHASGNNRYSLLAFLNTNTAVRMLEAHGRHRLTETVAIKDLPLGPKELQAIDLSVRTEVEVAIAIMTKFETIDEVNRLFLLPGAKGSPESTVNELTKSSAELSAICRTVDDKIRSTISIARGDTWKPDASNWCYQLSQSQVGIMRLAHLVGCIIGRWDIRYTTGEKEPPPLPEPFDPLPVCPPGMLQNAAGLPAMPEDVPADYPLRISWSGILVDDDGHTEDIASRVHEALQVIWQERADDIEAEACGILGVDSLRDYFGNPNQFFADHLSRYSKSRRAAPIYWPLTTANGSYTLWLYYHRLSDSILYQCVNDFVDPKLAAVQRQLTGLRGRARNRDEERDLERLTDLAVELETFRKDLLDLARFWRPNLNDGVQITAAPLHALFGHRPWRERLAETWEQLKSGDYDWAHLAMSIWPSRVVPKCTEDRSLAIAHDIEPLFWIEEEGRWRPLDDPDAEAARQIELRQSAARDRLRELLASLATDEGRHLPAMEIWQSLSEGAWDHRPLGLHLYPERAAEAAFADSTLVFPNLEDDDQQLLAKRTKKNQKLLTQRLLDRGSPELADAVGATLANEPVDFATLWAELAAGQRDAVPLALALWPERVVAKARKDRDLAAQHGLFNYFWYDEPSVGVRQRQTIRREIDHEVERRGGDKL